MSGASRGAFDIHLRLSSLDELFSSLDPSPLIGRDLDNIIEEYVVDCVREAASDAPLRLCVHIPGPAPSPSARDEAEAGIRNYFAFLHARQSRLLARFFSRSRRQAFAGALFLATCIAGSQILERLGPRFPAAAIAEGLIILGWVANWRPLSAFLHDWRPLQEQRHTYHRLSLIELVVAEDNLAVSPPAPGAARRD